MVKQGTCNAQFPVRIWVEASYDYKLWVCMEDKLWILMEDCYRKHGASCNGAQLIMRGDDLDYMRTKYSDDEIGYMLINEFEKYHVLSGMR